MRAGETMDTAKQFVTRWKTEYDFKTYISAAVSLMVTLIFAFYNGFLGIHHNSLWYGAICVYYIMLTLLRGLIITAAKRIFQRKSQKNARNNTSLVISFLLLILNISLIVPISIMVKQQKPVSLTLIPAIAMGAYTTYQVIMASVNLRRRKATSDSLVWLLRTISFIDALVSILTLQNTLIMVNSNGKDLGMLPLTAISSAFIWVAALLLSLNAIIKEIKRAKNG